MEFVQKHLPDELIQEKQQASVQANFPKIGTATATGGLPSNGDFAEGNIDFLVKLPEPQDNMCSGLQMENSAQHSL